MVKEKKRPDKYFPDRNEGVSKDPDLRANTNSAYFVELQTVHTGSLSKGQMMHER